MISIKQWGSAASTVVPAGPLTVWRWHTGLTGISVVLRPHELQPCSPERRSIFTAQRDLAFTSYCCCCTLPMCVPHFSSQTSGICEVETQAVTSLYTIGQIMVWFCFVFFKSTQGFKLGQVSWLERICSTIHGQKSVIWKEIWNISNNSWSVNFLIFTQSEVLTIVCL